MKQRPLSYAIAIAALVCCTHSKTFSQTDWHITGNSGTSASASFVGTTDNIPLTFRTNNAVRMRINGNGNTGIGTTAPVQKLDVNGNINIKNGFGLYVDNHKVLMIDSLTDNTFLGIKAGASTNGGTSNTAAGCQALFANTIGFGNTAYGTRTLTNNSMGDLNVAIGHLALYSNITGSSNTANGHAALTANTSGNNNVATGALALSLNTSGNDNTAGGYQALYVNTTGKANTATGSGALSANTSGSYCTATGYNALMYNKGNENNAYGVLALGSNTTGTRNTGIGNTALFSNGTGSFNTGIGYGTLYANGTGAFNTGVGYATLYATTSSQNNTAVGYRAGSGHNNGWNNVFLGAGADVNGEDYYNDVAIGQGTICTTSNQACIGNAATTSIGGYANWTNISDGRVKKNMKENVPGLAFINKLKPLTYNLDLDAADKIIQPPAKKDKDGKLIVASQLEINARNAKQQILYTGFVAQDVEKAAKEINYDFSGVDAAKNDKDLYGLRYAEFVVPLVKAVQELSKKVEKLEAALAEKGSGTASTALSTNIIISNTSLEQNTPNPFNSATRINYTLPQQFSSAKIIVTDKSGKILKEVNISGSGKSSVNIDGSNLPSGAYQYSLYVDSKLISTKQMILTK